MELAVHFIDFLPGDPAKLGPTLADAAKAAEQGGATLFTLADHFFQMENIWPAENPFLEGYTSLGFLAAQTTTIELSLLVTGVTYRYPGVLAKAVSTLDVLSQGRSMLGLGAAWYDREHAALGIPYPPLRERFEMLEETLQICQQMWRGDESPYHGVHYQLERPLNSPQSLTRPHPPIMIGGGGEKKTLRLVARYADACNLFPSPDLGRKLDVLREHCEAEGRDYDEITKTCYFVFDVGEKGEKGAEVVDQLGRLAELGFDAAMGQVVNLWQVTPLEVLAAEVVPAVADL